MNIAATVSRCLRLRALSASTAKRSKPVQSSAAARWNNWVHLAVQKKLKLKSKFIRAARYFPA